MAKKNPADQNQEESKPTKRAKKKKSNKNKQEKNKEQKEENVDQTKKMLIFTFPRDNKYIRLKVKPLDLRYLAELIDIYTEHFPEFYNPLTQKILQDLPKLVEVTEDSIPIDVEKLSSPIPYTSDRDDCNPLTFSELRRVIDEIITFASILPPNDWFVQLTEIDVTPYYDDIFKPNNTFFTLRDNKLVVLKVDPINFLDAASIIDKIQAQQVEIQQAKAEGRKPKLILTQKWLFEHLIPKFPELLTCHPKSPVKIDVSKVGSFNLEENPLLPFEIHKIIEMILRVSGVLPEDLTSFH